MTDEQPATLADDLLDRIKTAEEARDQALARVEAETARAARADARHLTASNRAGNFAAERDRLRARLDRLITAAPAADHAHRQLRAIREARAHTCERDCTEGGCDFDLAGFLDRVDEILANNQDDRLDLVFDRDPDCGCTPPCGHGTYRLAGGPGSSRRAQDALVLTWDWCEQPDVNHLHSLLAELTGGLVHVYAPETGTDDCAWVFATRPLTDKEARDALEAVDEPCCTGITVPRWAGSEPQEPDHDPDCALRPVSAIPARVEPSQGQEIPAEQLQALLTEAATRFTPDANRLLATSGYRIGFAAALGYEITVEDGRVGAGDRPEPAAIAPEAAEAARKIADALQAAIDERDTARADLAQALALLDGRYAIRLTVGGPGLDRWHGDALVGAFATADTAREIGQVLAHALADHVGVRVDASLVELPRQVRRGGPVSAGGPVIVGERPVDLMDRTARWPTGGHRG
ncbi:hypothetical protein [Phytohabitans aurantiacus]|uniref:Uncharacterized protein n=1 Tax=Phytohabitans aurantiacus TaxID=3016789 RepID=A0ABQ5QSW5_9ACTN|nr:hypothetical protein [Phytohabitans aurantiacus]GLH97370.1 hypothetical protein Pa4123_26450 [Phytohabitans aurantiacus]